MKTCQFCAAEIPEDAVTCPACGNALYEEPVYEEVAPAPEPARSGYAFAGILAIAGAAALIVGTLVSYAGGESGDVKIVDFHLPFRFYAWSILAQWGPAVVIALAGLVLAFGSRPAGRPAALLTGAAMVLFLQAGSSFFRILVGDTVPQQIGAGVSLEFGGAVAALLGGLTALVRRT